MKDMELGQVLKIIFQSVYKRLKMSKKERQFFSLRVILYRFNKSWPKIKTSVMPVKGPVFKKIFIFK